MKLSNFIKLVAPYIPALASVLGMLLIVMGLITYFPEDRISQLENITYLVCILSALLVVIILFFILNQTNQLRYRGDHLNKEISSLTQKLHYFRDIADLLVRSKVWAPGLKEYIDDEFAGLNYFNVKEFYKGRSKLAVEYMEEKDRYGDTESLYLETKAILLNNPKQSKTEHYMNPKTYDQAILEKWVEHSVGSGLNHFFGYKYNNLKEELDVQRVFERHQEKIVSYAVQIDTVRYQDFGFSEDLLSKLGAHLSEELLPRLLELTVQSHRKVPSIVIFAFLMLVALVVFGVFQPIVTILFGLPVIFNFISIATVLGMLLFMMLSIYPFVSKQINK